MAVTGPAAAYHEAHVTADDVRIMVDGAGIAKVDHAITLRVASGTLKTFDVTGLEPGAPTLAEANVAGESSRGESRALVEPHGKLDPSLLSPLRAARLRATRTARYLRRATARRTHRDR